jgi:serine/threonine protein kinase
MNELLGKTLDKSYRIDQLLGRGGMGAVYRAHDVALDRDVAIKVMHPHFTDDEGFRARFLQEARAIAALDHPGIVQVYAFGQDLGLLYIVMDFISGQSLHDWLKRLADENKIVALAESLAIVREVANALHYAHEKGVLHRDIKPGNIMLEPADPMLREGSDLPFRPVLTDFGLAKLAEGGVQTQTGTSMGTPAYMSPEQCLGMELDRRADVYALGVVLYQMATGRVPFEVRSLTEAIRRHTQEPPPPPRSINPTLPAEVEDIILRALAKRPEDRLPSAKDMAEALQKAIAHLPTGLSIAPTMADMPSTPAGQYVSLMTRLAEESVLPAAPSTEAWEAAPPSGQPGAALVVIGPDQKSRRVPLTAPCTLIAGRTAGNDLHLPDPRISRHHARIEFDGQACTVADLNSTNGTFLGQSRLLPGVAQPWPAGIPLRIGAHWLRFESQTAAGRTASATMTGMAALSGMPQAAAPSRRPAVALEPETLNTEAGQPVFARLRILNQSTQVDHFSTAVDGIPPSWVGLPKEPLRLTPGEEGILTLTLQPPREPRSAAGPHAFHVRVASQADPGQVAQTSAALTIEPFYELAAELSPQQITGRRTRLKLANRGNAPSQIEIVGTDPAEALRIKADPARLTLQAGQEQIAPLEVQPKKGRPWLGSTQRYPFTLQVSSATGQALRQGGTLIVRPYIPIWVIPLILLPLILLCLVLGYLYVRPPVIHSITLDPPNPRAGQPVTIHWEVGRADTIEIRPLQSGLDPEQGQYAVAEGFEGSTSLTLVASNRFGSVEEALTIDVIAPTPTPMPEPLAPVLEEWSVFPTELTLGQSVTIKWRVSNAEDVTLQPFGTVDQAGEIEDVPQQTKTYTLIAANQGKTMQKSQEVVVVTPAPDAPVVKAFTAEPATVIKGSGDPVRLTWDTENADTVTIEPGVGPVGLAGSRDVAAPDEATVYTLVARGAGGETRQQVQVEVALPDAPIIQSFTAQPNTVVKGEGGTVRLTWATENADAVTIQPSLGAVEGAGSRDLAAPMANTTYELVATNPGGEQHATVEVQVQDPTPMPKPDLVLQVSAPASAAAGSSVAVPVRVRNTGGAEAAGTDSASSEGYMIDIVLSKDTNVPSGWAVYQNTYREDVMLRGGRLSSTPDLVPGADKLYERSYEIQGDTPAGDYYICAQVDPANKIDEGNEDNNITCAPIRIEPPASSNPDLVLQLAAPASAAAGAQVEVTVQIRNAGGARAAGTDSASSEGYMVDIVLSKDTTVPDGFAVYQPNYREDVLLRGGRLSNTPDLAPGADQSFTRSYTIPADTPAGSYYVCARIDPGRKIAEDDETNNVACRPIQVN